MKRFFSNIRKRVSLLVSLCLMFILSSIIVFSLFLSDLSLEKLGQSRYFQSKVNEVLKQSEIDPEGIISIKLNKFGGANIKIEKATFLNFSDLVVYDINLKIDFIKYWFGINFIDEVSLMKVVYSLPNSASLNIEKMSDLGLKFLTHYLYEPLSEINSKSIYIENSVLKYQTQIFEFRNIYLAKSKELLTAKARMNHKPNAKDTAFSAIVNLSLNETNILKFNIVQQDNKHKGFLYLERLPKTVRVLFDSLVQNNVLPKEKKNKIKLAGTYDLNSTVVKSRRDATASMVRSNPFLGTRRLTPTTSGASVSPKSFLFLNCSARSRGKNRF